MMPCEFSNRFPLFAKRTTFHGFREISDSKNLVQKSVWIMIMLSCTGMLIFHIYQQVSQFIEGRKGTRVNMYEFENYEFPPVLLVVNYRAWMSREKIIRYRMTYEETQIARSYFEENVKYDSELPLHEAKVKFEEKMRSLNVSKLFDLHFLIAEDAYGPKRKAFGSMIGGYLIDTSVAEPSIFGKSWMTSFTFDFIKYSRNMAENRRFLKIDQNESHLELTGWNSKWPILTNFDTNQIVPLKPGMMYEVSSDIRIYRKLDNCTSKHDSNNWYTIKSCETECAVKANLSLNVTNCFGAMDGLIPITPSFLNGDLPLCSLGLIINGSVVGKNQQIHRNLTPKESEWRDQAVVECQKSCLPKCEKWMTTWSVVSYEHDWPDRDFISVIQMSFPTTEMLMVIQEVEQYKWHDLVSDIGGLLGLWLGASMMSLFQLIHLCCWAEERRDQIHVESRPKINIRSFYTHAP